MSQSENTVEFSKKRKRNDAEEGQNQVLSFQELKLSVQTKHLAKRLQKASGSIL